MSVTLYPLQGRGNDPTKMRGVEGSDQIGKFLVKTGTLSAPLQIRGHRDHILEMLEKNKHRHINVLYDANRLYAFCTPSLEPNKKRMRVGGLKTSGVSAIMAIAGLASWAIRGKYMSLYVTDSEHDSDAFDEKSRPVEFTRSVTFADLKAIVSSY